MAPLTHAVLPDTHRPTSVPQLSEQKPLMQVWPAPRQSLSMTHSERLSGLPSQSLSMPSHTSMPGCTSLMQTHWFTPWQTRVPCVHGETSAPAPLPLLLQSAPGGKFQLAFWWVQLFPGKVQQPGFVGASVRLPASSMEPLQLLSMPSHTSF
jgi:hypothetical protein